jgi:hypothetical protein
VRPPALPLLYLPAGARLTQPNDRFEKMHPTPSWANDARKKKRRRAAGSSDDESEAATDEDEEDESGLQAALRSTETGKIKRGRKALPGGTIDLARVRDANFASTPPGKVNRPTVSLSK